MSTYGFQNSSTAWFCRNCSCDCGRIIQPQLIFCINGEALNELAFAAFDTADGPIFRVYRAVSWSARSQNIPTSFADRSLDIWFPVMKWWAYIIFFYILQDARKINTILTFVEQLSLRPICKAAHNSTIVPNWCPTSSVRPGIGSSYVRRCPSLGSSGFYWPFRRHSKWNAWMMCCDSNAKLLSNYCPLEHFTEWTTVKAVDSFYECSFIRFGMHSLCVITVHRILFTNGRLCTCVAHWPRK